MSPADTGNKSFPGKGETHKGPGGGLPSVTRSSSCPGWPAGVHRGE